jgi:hypothetical protein
MDKNEANRILDRHKETKELSYADATRALAATGDFEELRSERMDFEIQEESERPWENECIRLVVSDLIRHREKAWVKRR